MEKLVVNRILCTKNGRKIGNAIIQEISEELFPIIGKTAVYHCMTDYGNRFGLISREIDELFYIGRMATREHKFWTEVL